MHSFRIAAMLAGIATGSVWPTAALAHASSQSFVALLPTGPYRLVGVVIVGVSISLLALLPPSAASRPDGPRSGWPGAPPGVRMVVSLLSALLLVWLISAGFLGSRDPLENGLVLAFWVVFWMALVIGQGLFGNLWGWLSPFNGIGRLFERGFGWRGFLRLPGWLGAWPAVFLLLGFSGFTLADPAPDDPARLAGLLICYGIFTLAGMGLFGARSWLARVEFFTVLMRQFVRLAPLVGQGRFWRLDWPAAALCRPRKLLPGLSVFCVVLLGTGSFDGFNETFFWLDLIGVNPLAFPGRSAVIVPVLAGLVGANILLLVLFTCLLLLGDRLAGARRSGAELLMVFAPTLLPIALGYHIAHYLPSLLVDGQYALLALNDPLSLGQDWLGLAGYHVTTGFFNNRDTMNFIWLAQAAGIVFGHVLAVIVADRRAVRLYQGRRAVWLAQAPLALFMIGYTWLGLWLLAAPKGG